MRVENGAVNSANASPFTEKAGKSTPESRAAAPASSAASDRSSLSNATDLVTLAKNLVPSDRVARFQAVNAAVSAGQYQPDAAVVSEALVGEHLNS